jgi:hypothetical protein
MGGHPPQCHFTELLVVLISSKALIPQYLQDYFLPALGILPKQGGAPRC